jgi:hypothetical protein
MLIRRVNFCVWNSTVFLVRYFILAAYCHGVGIQDIFGLENRGSVLGRGKIFLFSVLLPALGPTQPLVQWVPGALSSGVKRPGREADLSSAEVKNGGAYVFMKHRHDYTFTCGV